jgi:hypothetical protein
MTVNGEPREFSRKELPGAANSALVKPKFEFPDRRTDAAARSFGHKYTAVFKGTIAWI